MGPQASKCSNGSNDLDLAPFLEFCFLTFFGPSTISCRRTLKNTTSEAMLEDKVCLQPSPFVNGGNDSIISMSLT